MNEFENVGKLSDWMMKWDVTVTQGKKVADDTQKTIEDGIKFVEKSAPIVKKKLEEDITMLQTVDYKWKNEPIETVWWALWSWGFYVFLAWLFKWLRLRGRDSFGDKIRKNIFAQKTL